MTFSPSPQKNVVRVMIDNALLKTLQIDEGQRLIVSTYDLIDFLKDGIQLNPDLTIEEYNNVIKKLQWLRDEKKRKGKKNAKTKS